MTMDNDHEKANRRVARANTIRKANMDGTCPCCGDATPYRRIAALWKAAFTMQDAEIGDMAWEAEQALSTQPVKTVGCRGTVSQRE